MRRAELVSFLRGHKLAVQASRTEGAPQSAVIGFVVSDDLEIFFDTLESSRKAKNLRADGRISMVIGWSFEDARTVQLEGLADEPKGEELAPLQKLYFASFPDGVDRQKAGGIAYFRVRPTWARLSDFRGPEPVITEIDVAR
jgi:pyridoxine/pyridoxamine 5'-phosphate oxidase